MSAPSALPLLFMSLKPLHSFTAAALVFLFAELCMFVGIVVEFSQTLPCQNLFFPGIKLVFFSFSILICNTGKLS